jgi:predicted component of type VI protein secretion system
MKVNIIVNKRSSAIVEEEYTLEVDQTEYDKYMEEHPEATAEEIANALEGERTDYDVSIEDIGMVHSVEYCWG